MYALSLWWKDEGNFLQPGCLLSPVTLYWLSEQAELTESFIYVLIYIKYMNMAILHVCMYWITIGWVTSSHLHYDVTVPSAEEKEGGQSFRSFWVIWNQCWSIARLYHRREDDSMKRSEKKAHFFSQHYKCTLCQSRDKY